ncbi:thioredoxin family protein [Metabacillus malikii]|uniref:Thiol-disulfide isomerase/thioredoxin n=1 Tax=Metabacillus malikii TaxID=1504265 RepID=A0ABT9ZDM6_9BACI|nr:thioredoxin family protein [Metabacillus malikii]MDQ0229683.1 thiol-disulfide isomerase/thioredoxin [Metabacillus malikii]
MNEWEEKQLDIPEEGLAVFYLYTPMCGTCQVAKKMLTIVEELLPSMVVHAVNLNYYPKEAKQLGIESVPCLLVIEDGDIKEQIYAFQSVSFLYECLKKFDYK